MSLPRFVVPVAAIALATGAFGGGIVLRGALDGDQDADTRGAGRPALSLAQSALTPTEALAAGPDRFPPFGFLDQNSKPRALSDWDGETLVVNFWATWCPPCVDEIPEFIEAQNDYRGRNVQFVGIALDDIDSVRAFLQQFALNYPTAAGDDSAFDLMLRVGNPTGGLPFTVLIGEDGRIAYRHAGPMNRRQLDEALAPLIKG